MAIAPPPAPAAPPPVAAPAPIQAARVARGQQTVKGQTARAVDASGEGTAPEAARKRRDRGGRLDVTV
jgi:hypothetical protein